MADGILEWELRSWALVNFSLGYRERKHMCVSGHSLHSTHTLWKVGEVWQPGAHAQWCQGCPVALVDRGSESGQLGRLPADWGRCSYQRSQSLGAGLETSRSSSTFMVAHALMMLRSLCLWSSNKSALKAGGYGLLSSFPFFLSPSSNIALSLQAWRVGCQQSC